MRIFNNLLYKGVALLLAVALWSIAQGFRDIERSIDIPVSLEGTPEEVVVVAQSSSEINLLVSGSRAAVRRAARQLVRYPISLDGIRPGEARFAVVLDRLDVPRGARISARSPSSVALTIEPRIEKEVRVRLDLVGVPPPGYRLLDVSVEPSRVVLAGARSVLRRLRDVLTDRIDVSEQRETIDREVRLALDSSLIWRAEDGPIRVRVEIAKPEEPVAAEDGTEAS